MFSSAQWKLLGWTPTLFGADCIQKSRDLVPGSLVLRVSALSVESLVPKETPSSPGPSLAVSARQRPSWLLLFPFGGFVLALAS